MDFEKFEKKEKLEVEGFIAGGKQFDLDIRVPEDNRDVIFGIIKDSYGDPIADAVVKLIEVEKREMNYEKRKPVSHTFTDEHGEFVFGPLCPHKKYAVEIWVNRVEHVKICEICRRKGRCLKGVELDCDDHCKADFKEAECDCDKE